jgi:hypothetical protein
MDTVAPARALAFENWCWIYIPKTEFLTCFKRCPSALLLLLLPSHVTPELQQGLAAYLLTQVPLMQAAAYTLAKVAELSSWKPEMQAGYELVPFSSCCSLADNLPKGFVQAVRVWGQTLGQPAHGAA